MGQHGGGDAETSVTTPSKGCVVVRQTGKITFQQRRSCVFVVAAHQIWRSHIDNTTVQCPSVNDYISQLYKETAYIQ